MKILRAVSVAGLVALAACGAPSDPDAGATGGGTGTAGGGSSSAGGGSAGSGGGTAGGTAGGGTGGATGGGTGGGSATGGGTGTGGGTAAGFDAGSIRDTFAIVPGPTDNAGFAWYDSPMVALAIDGTGGVHVLGHADHDAGVVGGVVLGHFNGPMDGGFSFERVNNSSQRNLYRLVYSPDGMPHFLFDASGAALFYGRRDGGGFEVSEVEPGGRVPLLGFDMMLGSDGGVQLAYALTNALPVDGGTTTELAFRHAERAGATWTITDLGRAPYAPPAGDRVRIARGPGGEPIVAYATGQAGGGCCQFVVASRAGGAWSEETAGQISGVNHLSFAVNTSASGDYRMLLVQDLSSGNYGVSAKTNAGPWQQLTARVSTDGGLYNTETLPIAAFGPDGTAYVMGRRTASPQVLRLHRVRAAGVESTTLLSPITGTTVQNQQGNSPLLITPAGIHTTWRDASWRYSVIR